MNTEKGAKRNKRKI